MAYAVIMDCELREPSSQVPQVVVSGGCAIFA